MFEWIKEKIALQPTPHEWKAKVLILDDDEDSISIITNFLNTSAYVSQRSFKNEIEAVNYIKSPKICSEISMYIIDVQLESLNGFEVGQYIRKKLLLDTPIVYVSSRRRNKDIFDSQYDQGNTFFLEKPIMKDHLLSILNRSLIFYAPKVSRIA